VKLQDDFRYEDILYIFLSYLPYEISAYGISGAVNYWIKRDDSLRLYSILVSCSEWIPSRCDFILSYIARAAIIASTMTSLITHMCDDVVVVSDRSSDRRVIFLCDLAENTRDDTTRMAFDEMRNLIFLLEKKRTNCASDSSIRL